MAMKRVIAALLCILILLPSAQAAGYPKKKINGIIQWGAGGGTDCLMRPLCALAEKELGGKLALRNMTGGTGSIAAQYVFDAKADGYVSGLGYLYEFDLGPLSGWMFFVNGRTSSVGASDYTLQEGDTVEWRYTRALGEDIGGGFNP